MALASVSDIASALAAMQAASVTAATALNQRNAWQDQKFEALKLVLSPSDDATRQNLVAAMDAQIKRADDLVRAT